MCFPGGGGGGPVAGEPGIVLAAHGFGCTCDGKGADKRRETDGSVRLVFARPAYAPTVREVARAAALWSHAHAHEAACRALQFVHKGFRAPHAKWHEYGGDALFLMAGICERTSGAAQQTALECAHAMSRLFVQQYSGALWDDTLDRLEGGCEKVLYPVWV